MLVSLYFFLSSLLTPLWYAMGFLRLLKKKEKKEHLPSRYGITSFSYPREKIIWFHGASIGECRSSLSLIQCLLDRHDDISVLLTSQSASTFEALKPYLPSRVYHTVPPYDCPLYVNRFLAYWNPKAFCVVESEMWPCLFHSLHKQGCPLFLVNYHLSQRTANSWAWLRPFFEENYRLFQERWTSCPDSYQRFRKLTSLSMEEMPSLKYTFSVEQDPLPPSFSEALQGKKSWVASCIHTHEAPFILTTHEALKKLFPSLVLFYIPRQFDSIPFIKKKALEKGWNYQSHSEKQPLSPLTDLYIVDTMGETEKFYRAFPFSILGGSFMPGGRGHSLIEPSAWSCAVIYGPSMLSQNALIKDFKGSSIQATEETLVSFVKAWIETPSEAQAIGKKAQEVVKKKAEALEKWRDPFLDRLIEKMKK